jgi:hypothetical protein
MKASARIVGLFFAVALAATALGGCEPPLEKDDGVWVYDFTADGDDVPNSAWYVDDDDSIYLTSGLNTCTMVRSGSTVTISMNGALVATVTVTYTPAEVYEYDGNG